MGFKRTPEGRVFFQGADSANDEIAMTKNSPKSNQQKASNPSPQMRSPLTGEKTQGQIVTLLKTLNERLKVTQADRDRMMKELDKHRSIIEDLEDKAERSEKLALDLEHKLETGAGGTAKTNTQAAITELEKTRKALLEMERKQTAHNKALTDKVTKSSSGMKALQRRIESTEAKQSVIDERIESALSEQAKLIRKVDKAIEDRARFMRKIERIEETVIQTRDSLNAKAMVLLTEQGASTGQDINEGVSKYLPDDLEDQINEASQKAKRVADIQTPQKKASADTGIYAKQTRALPWWQNASLTGALAGVAAFILAVLVMSILALNDWRWPGNQTVDDTSEIVAQSYYQTPQTPIREEMPPVQMPQAVESLDWEIEQDPQVMELAELPETVPNDVGTVDLNNVEEVTRLIEEEPQRVAAALNEIEPQKQTPAAQEPAPPATPLQDPSAGTKPNPAQADTLAAQMQRDSNLPNMIKNVEDQAFQGIGEAQHDLAAIYTAGHGGVQQDYNRAAYWFEKAAENGIANASYNLGVLHHQGLGFDSDVKEAMSWYKDAASKGHPEAQYNLGIAYIEGIGVPYDPVTASNYFENAANSGVMEAAYNLGLIYENGLLGNAEPDKALLWYKTAADQGSPEAKQALNDLANTLAISTDDVNRMVDDMRLESSPPPSIIEQLTPQKESSALQTQQPYFNQYSSAAADQGTIAQIQEYLMRAGLYPGPADGVNGALTQDAIRSYQSLHNMNTNGEPTQNLLGHMLANANRSAVFQSASDLIGSGSRAQ